MTEHTSSSKPAVLSVAFPYACLGPKAVGGAEVICTQIEASLLQSGFQSVVVAHAASRVSGKLYPTQVPEGPITDAHREAVEAAQQENIDRALTENDVALIHMHGLDFHRYRIPPHVPVLVTLHLPVAWYPETIWDLPDNYHLVCVSENQRRTSPAAVQSRLTVVENGVPFPDAALLRSEGRYALMLARICLEKNLHVGFDAAALAGMPCMLGGEVFPYEAHQRYLREQIEPRLTTATAGHEARTEARQVEPARRFLGPVSGEEKQRLLTRAACLLLPSLAPETSSLVAMEALAAGVPVIAMAVGAVPDIVQHGVTGFLIQPGDRATEEMAHAIGRLSELDRNTCRATAEAQFPLSRMVERYCSLYYRLAASTLRRAPAEVDTAIEARSSMPQASVEPSQPVSFHVQELRGNRELEALLPEWLALWQADPGATPFQHPAWLLPWWHQFGPDGTLCAVALRNEVNGRLAGLLPTYLYRQPSSGRRQMLLIGAGTTDYLDGVWSAQTAKAAASAALTHVLQLTDWDQVSLHQIRASSPLLRAAENRRLPVSAAEPTSLLLVESGLPGKIRVNTNRYRRLAEARGALHCSVAEDASSALASFDALVLFHSHRWEKRGEEGVLRDERVLAHHRESLPQLVQAGLLRLFRLTLDGETVGVLYGLADGPHAAERRLYLYLIGFDERFASISPGTLLLHEAWLHAREHDFHAVDLLRGGESYKQLWGAQVQPNLALSLDRETE